MAQPPAGTLYVVASSIGNPGDLSPRAVATLRTADVVLAEDTRSARKLLAAHGIDRRTQSCFDANEAERAEQAAALLRAGQGVALVSEAGTPTVSDPGYRVVRAAIAAGARVVPVPGPSAVLAALVASGLPTDSFFFAGFPPRKTGARRLLFSRLAQLEATLVFYESPHRVGTTLAELVAVVGPARPACLARELTKTHEEFVRGSLGELATAYSQTRPLGEVTLVVGGAAAQESRRAEAAEDLAQQARALLDTGLSPRDVADTLAQASRRQRREIYQLVLGLRR
ncbi:MAG: 16S rRNA (cytidine(1402)-2'-O)-methyltransferase [Deltaproteobacteria bacterium]|nr:16S rRNA (cytidine(1402)-2'-O)-methyltransferase [Deltaproteobacteria bacterium]